MIEGDISIFRNVTKIKEIKIAWTLISIKPVTVSWVTRGMEFLTGEEFWNDPNTNWIR